MPTRYRRTAFVTASRAAGLSLAWDEQSAQRARGQASPEWLGVVLVVSLAVRGDGRGGRERAGRRSGSCARGEDPLRGRTWGRGVAVSRPPWSSSTGPRSPSSSPTHVPLLLYEDGMLSLPIDYRDVPGRRVRAGRRRARGETTNRTGEPVTLFSHVVDCRDPERARSARGGLRGRCGRQPLPPVLGLLPGLRDSSVRGSVRQPATTRTTGSRSRCGSAPTRSGSARAPTTATTARAATR